MIWFCYKNCNRWTGLSHTPYARGNALAPGSMDPEPGLGKSSESVHRGKIIEHTINLLQGRKCKLIKNVYTGFTIAAILRFPDGVTFASELDRFSRLSSEN